MNNPNNDAESPVAIETGLDRLSSLLERFPVRARLFHTGPLCGVSDFAAEPGRGFLHVMRGGHVTVTHGGDSGASRRLLVEEPTLFFYPRPLHHRFDNPPDEGNEFTCATVHFEGGALHPLVRALPAVIVVPLSAVPGLAPVLALLFAETGQVRCGQRLLADRLFDVLLVQLLRWLLDHGEASAGLIAGLGDPQLALALSAIHDRPASPWTIASMAHAAGMSRSAFSARFSTMLAQSPAGYLADLRIALACAQLRQGRPLKIIAHEVGYSGQATLSRAFSQRLGCSPREWLSRR